MSKSESQLGRPFAGVGSADNHYKVAAYWRERACRLLKFLYNICIQVLYSLTVRLAQGPRPCCSRSFTST